MSENILKKIINNKIKKISELKKTISIETLEAKIKENKTCYNNVFRRLS